MTIDLNHDPHRGRQAKPKQVDERPRIISALDAITASDHDTFFQVLASVQDALGEDGRDIAESWAQKQGKSRAKEFNYVWRSCTQGKGIGAGTVYHMAQQNGWRDDVQAKTLTREEAEARKLSKEEAQRLNREAQERNRARARTWTREILEAGLLPASDNPYLKRKLVSLGFGLKSVHADAVAEILGYRLKNERGELQGELLVVPCYRDFAQEPATLQLIDGEGRKVFLAGGGVGIWATVPFPAPGTPGLTFYVGEGVATCLSVSQAMQGGVGVSTGSNSQLAKTAQAIRDRYPGARIILLADLKKDSGAPDEKAVEAATLVGGCLAVPDFGPGREPGQTDFNDLHVVKGLDAVRACIEGVQAAQAASVWDSPVDIAAMLATKPEPMPWLVTERIPFGRGGGLAALGGTGKTTLLKALAVGCITGRLPMDGWEIERTGKVVLVLTEDTHAEFHEDLHRLCYGMTTHERELIARNLIVYPLAGKDTRLLTKSPRGVVEKSPLYHALVAKIQAIGGVVLVGLDPALGITEGDEMNQADQRALGRAVDDLGVTVGATCILLAHSTKALSSADELGSHSSRGGGALTDALRFEITMRGMTAKEATARGIEDLEERLHLVQVAITKGNRVPPSAKVPVWLKYDMGTLVSAELVEPEKKSKADGTSKLPKSAALAFEAIKEATMERGQIDDATGRPYVVMDDIRTTHKNLYTQRNPANGDRAERKALQDGTSKLAELGWIKSDGLTVSFFGPGAEVHIQNILAAMAERRGRNCGTERNFSELSSAKGTKMAEPNGTSPLNRGSSGSAKFRGDFDQEDETTPEQSEIPSSSGEKINPLDHGLWPEGVIHVREDCAGFPEVCPRCIHCLEDDCDGLTAPF